VSFFDDGDPPTRQSPRPARPRRPAPGPRGHAAAGAPDPHTARVRQMVALGVAALLLILMVVGINGCLDSRKERALKDYNREVAAIVESSGQVAQQFFDALNGGASGDDLQVTVNQIRLLAEEDAQRADDLDPPDEMSGAQRHLELVMNLREGAITEVAGLIPDVGSDTPATADRAVRRVAGEMQALLASDVVYSQRVQPLIAQELSDQDIGGQNIPSSKFLQSLAWLEPDTVADRLGAEAADTSDENKTASPGTHGHGLTSVSIGQSALQPGEVTNRIPAGSNVTFEVAFQNQGENDEQDVTVTVTVRGSGKPIVRRKRVDVTRAGQPATASIALGTAPPIGQPVTIDVVVGKVAGEKTTDNNRQSYTALFTRG